MSSTMDFALLPNWDPPRQGQAQFHASEILRLWPQGHVRDMLSHLLGARQQGYRVATILPTQELSAEDYEALEDAGVLVVEVPEHLSQSSEASIADYLTAQLNEGATVTAARMAAIGTSDPSATTTVVAPDELQLSDEDEAEFLEFINDPANQLGGHF